MDKNNKVAFVSGVGMDSKTTAHLLLSKGYTVVLSYRRNANQDMEKMGSFFEQDLVKNPNSKLDFVFMDICDSMSIRMALSSVLLKYGKIDEFYNFAAQSHVGDSFKNAHYTLMATGVSVFFLLDAIKELTPQTKFFQASTSEMFGGDPNKCPFNEKSEFEHRSPYALAKNLAYDCLVYYRNTYGMYLCTAFAFNHSNFYRHPSFFISKSCIAATRIALGKQKELVLGNLDFARDESFSDFCCEAFWKMLNQDKPTDYVIGRGEAFTADQFLSEIFGYYNLNWRDYVKQDKSLFRDNEVVKLVADSSKAEKELGWRPDRISLKDHVKLMCDWHYDLELGKTPIKPNVFELYP